jgi:hypothetical protein
MNSHTVSGLCSTTSHSDPSRYIKKQNKHTNNALRSNTFRLFADYHLSVKSVAVRLSRGLASSELSLISFFIALLLYFR